MNVTSNSTASTQLTFSGIQADLRMPNAPGRVDSGTMLARQNSGRMPWKLAGSGVTIASLLLLTLPRKRRLGSLLLVALAVALVGGASGCGSSQAAPPSTTTNTPTRMREIYVVTVVATYTASPSQVIQQSTTLTYSHQLTLSIRPAPAASLAASGSLLPRTGLLRVDALGRSRSPSGGPAR